MYLENLPNVWVFYKCPKYLRIQEISQLSGYFKNLLNVWVFRKSPKCLDNSKFPEFLYSPIMKGDTQKKHKRQNLDKTF